MSTREEDVFKRFRISREFGFLLENPDVELPSKYYEWQNLASQVSSLLGTEELDDRIRSLPLLEIDNLKTHKQLRLAHLILCTLSSAYLFAEPTTPKLVLCKAIAKPFYEVSQKLGISAVPTHGTVCLANWKKIDDNTEWNSENLDIIAFRFLPQRDNAWFFVNTAQVEKDLAASISSIALLVAKADKCEQISDDEYACCFDIIGRGLRNAVITMNKLKSHLRPEVFYHGFRHYLNGYNDSPFHEQGGLVFEGCDLGPQTMSGASAAQSSAIPTIDAFLRIAHGVSESDFLNSQLDFMPVPHREFILWVKKNSTDEVKKARGYIEVVSELCAFRSNHIKIVASYIVNVKKYSRASMGTGGTSFMHFLKTIRNNCQK